MTGPSFFDRRFRGLWNPNVERVDPGADDTSHESIVRSTNEDLERRDRRRAALASEPGRAKLWLATEALWHLVRDGLALTDDDLRAAIAEVDQRRGTMPGATARNRRSCLRCGAPVPDDRGSCPHCDEPAGLPLFP